MPCTVMPNARAQAATRLPMAPSPTTRIVDAPSAACSSWRHSCARCWSRNSASRFAPHITPAKANSATSGALAPGLWVTATPFARMSS